MVIYNSEDKTKGHVPANKGNQAKMHIGDNWYKLDYLGYEGASEYAVSEILKKSNIYEFVEYDMENVEYNGIKSHGCLSKNFLNKGEEVVTLEDMIEEETGLRGIDYLEGIPVDKKIRLVVNLVERVTGLDKFGEYLTTLLELDKLVLNEDRHFHNIAFVRNEDGQYKYCPIFDNGGSFLSDTHLDYSLDSSIAKNLAKVKAKPFSDSFDEQVSAAESLYGKQFQVAPGKLLPDTVINKIESVYGEDVATRIAVVAQIQQRNCAQYFSYFEKIPSWEANIFKFGKESDIER